MADNKTVAYKVAVASSDGIVVNQHFGRADTFHIYEMEESGSSTLLESRQMTPVCEGGDHDEKQLRDNIDSLKDCKYVLVSRIGAGAATVMEQSGIVPMELPDMIDEAIHKVHTYEQLQNLF